MDWVIASITTLAITGSLAYARGFPRKPVIAGGEFERLLCTLRPVSRLSVTAAYPDVAMPVRRTASFASSKRGSRHAGASLHRAIVPVNASHSRANRSSLFLFGLNLSLACFD